MPPRKNSNIESITEEYIDGAVKVHVKASEVPPRQNLNISFKDADMLGDEVTLSNQEAYEESHGKIYEMTHNNTVPWRNWAFYLILVSMLTVCFTFAKYASFASGDAQAAVAKFDVQVVGSSAADNVTIGTAQSYDGDISVVFGESGDNDATKAVTFTVTNNSDVTIKIANVVWADKNAPTHTTRFIYNSSANIAPNNTGTVTLEIDKYGSALKETVDNNQSHTLQIYVEQVD